MEQITIQKMAPALEIKFMAALLPMLGALDGGIT
jgi:hypothetical protein